MKTAKRTGTILVVVAAMAAGSTGAATARDTWAGEPFPPRPDMASYVTTAASGGGATWAFGSYTRPGAPTSINAQAFRRDESGGWQETPVPNIGNIVASAVTGPGDAWAVSSFAKVSAGGTVHWDGRAWTQVPLEVPGAPRISPSDVTAIGSDVWTIGKAYRDGEDPQQFSFAKRWDGTGWQDVPLPAAANDLSFSSVNGAAPNDLWLAGTTSQRPAQLVAMHWDGRAWTQTPVPPVDVPATDYLTVHDVAAYSPADVWISATHAVYDEPDHSLPVLMHWDGTAWTRQPAPVPTGGLGRLVPAEGALWNLGSEALLRYDGSSWQAVAGPPEGRLGTGTELPDGRLLGIGSQGATDRPQPFAAVHNR
ncbi:hypothetical protein [Amycolatopsis nigrescens]|uniref:hypothetical protein n=1 Tax=Amycolatopsis nigrescens TaxID=381445 RepID=UPI001FE0424E|nr:hypothetical protein [Amycolatopsis nigrescens]